MPSLARIFVSAVLFTAIGAGCSTSSSPLVADAGRDQIAESGVKVTLHGKGSGGTATDYLYLWQQVAGVPVSLSEAVSDAPSFTAPEQAGVVTFTLMISDGRLFSAPDEVSVLVMPSGVNHPPLAWAGDDRTVARRAKVELAGVANDVDGDLLESTWLQVSGPPVSLVANGRWGATFTAPDVEGVLVFSFAATDGGLSDTDEVRILVENRSPVIASASIAPAQARTLDDVTFTVSASDPDDDPLTIAYAWTRNGAAVEGVTGATFPNALTSKGDTIGVTATVSDGLAEVQVDRALTIQDTLPTLTAKSTLPAELNLCSAVAFELSASDVDGDPLGDFVLAHGPAGMTVSPSGTVSWDGCLPMFDRSIDVHWAAGLSLHPGAELGSTLRVDDPSRDYPLRRTGIEIPVYGSGLSVTDLDGNGTVEVLVASRRVLYELAPSGSTYVQRWVYPFATPDGTDFRAVASRDLDGDGRQEIFFASKGFVVKLDGVARREVARYPTGATNACTDLELADLRGDGDLELVCMAAGDYGSADRVLVLDPSDLSLEWQSSPGSLGASLALGNVDADPAIEIVTAKGYVFDGATLANEWAYGPGFGSRVDTGDLDGDGIEEIVGMAEWSHFSGFSAVSKSPLWDVSVFDSDALLVADFDGDAKAEILIGDGQWGKVTAYRYEASNNTLPVLFAISSQDHGVSSIGVGDVDGDGAIEFIWGSGETSSGDDVFVIAGRNPSIAVEWKNSNPNQLDGPFIGGYPAQVTATSRRLLFGTATTNSGYDGSRLVTLDPATGETQVTAELGSNWNGVLAFTASDYDQDGTDEALIATSNVSDGYFTAYDVDGKTSEWTTAKGLGTGMAVVSDDLNGDGFPDFVTITREGYVLAYDVKHQLELWKSTDLGTGVDVQVADLDGDGVKELVALASDGVYVYAKASGSTLYAQRASAKVSSGADLLVADLDGDLVPEISVLEAGYWSTAVRRFDGALALLGTFAAPPGAASLHLESTRAGRHNLLLGVGGSTSVAPDLRAVDPSSGSEIWRSPPLPGAVSKNSVFFTDLSGSATPEIVFATQSGMNLTR